MRINLFLHGFSVFAILLLSIFIVYENTGNRDSSIQSELRFTLTNGLDEIIKSNGKGLEETVRNLSVYPNESNLKYLDLIESVARKTETILDLLDSLQRHPSIKLANVAQKQWREYQIKMVHVLTQNGMLEEQIPRHEYPFWLSQSVRSDDYSTFFNNVEEVKIQVALTEEFVLCFIAQSVACDIRIDPYTPLVSHQLINPNVGDTTLADVLLTSHKKPYLPIAYYFDGIQLPSNKKGVASFQVCYERPGLYPLRFAIVYPNWLTDSTEHFEKTYLLRVRE